MFDGSLSPDGGRLTPQCGPKDEHSLAWLDGLGCLALGRIHCDFPSFSAQPVTDRFQGIGRRIEEVDRVGQEVVHPRVELHRAPHTEIQQGECFLHCTDELADGLGIEGHPFAQP